ncbi:hypothetical protein DPMN_152183 [Dreissena polymorpha]|uniref:Uncharacterized protein n=1 Tax=Dreissena polymorpha TaxID=45954 RepID=A0A9D4FJY0_DREPO|nr:hypothetical protein DPMN_152183 [Dreissena polymorpha]
MAGLGKQHWRWQLWWKRRRLAGVKIIITGAPSGGQSGPAAGGPSRGASFSGSGSNSGFFCGSTGGVAPYGPISGPVSGGPSGGGFFQDQLQAADSLAAVPVLQVQVLL